LWQTGAGFGGLALTGMLSGDGFFGNAQAYDGKKLPEPHFAPKAKNVIFLFMYGGPSHIDTFDYKPTMKGRDNQMVTVKTFGRGGHKNQGRIVELTGIRCHARPDRRSDLRCKELVEWLHASELSRLDLSDSRHPDLGFKVTGWRIEGPAKRSFEQSP
jgi:hypothetical protein